MQIEQAVRDIAERIGRTANAEAVFGETRQLGDMAIIPVAEVRYGGGMGFGRKDEGEEQEEGVGGGGGMGLNTRPLGVIVVQHDSVQWRPILDTNRLVVMGSAIGLVALLALRRIALAFAHR